mmetsp:Transcript_10642/g.11894  ORF Transcript_10642/g.11894 Transcript_10642/m.11894 type:complete len:95 (-) Transcript_10642:84-368(-)
MMPKKTTLRDRYPLMPSESTSGVMIDTSFRAPVLNSKAPVASWSLSPVAGVAAMMSSFALRVVSPPSRHQSVAILAQVALIFVQRGFSQSPLPL